MAHTFEFTHGPALLRRTPALLDAWLRELSDAWLASDEGPGTWNPVVVLGHLIEGELHDWLPRTCHILLHGERVAFAPFDRFAQLRAAPRPIAQLLDEFHLLRQRSLTELAALNLSPADLDRRGQHPEFGVVTLGQHLATWVAHDLTHVVQIARAMANRYRSAVGPWRAYLRVLQPVP